MPPQPIVNGKAIQSLRQRLNWTQGQLAQRAGVSQSVLSRLENNKDENAVSINHVGNIARALAVPVSHVLNDPYYRVDEPLPNLEQALEAVVRKLAEYDSVAQRRAAFILEGYVTALIFERDDGSFMSLEKDT